MNTTLQQAYDLFFFDRETFCVKKTIDYYKKSIGFFLDYIIQSGFSMTDDITAIPSNILSEYVRHLRSKVRFSDHPFAKSSDEVKIKNTTVRTYSRAVKAFLNYCNLELDTKFRVQVKFPRDDSDEKVPLYQEEVQLIDKQFSLKTETGIRNWCIFHCMLDAGLRSEEVQALKINDILFDKNILKIVDSKGNKSRVVFLCPKLKKNLYTYLMLFRGFSLAEDYENNFLFTKIRGDGYLNYNCIKMIFSRVKKHTSIIRLTPHLLRHTFATSYIMGGGNLENLRLLLGHYDYTVTRTYLHLANTYTLMHADIYRLDPTFFRTGY